jgi:hypothetical protein
MEVARVQGRRPDSAAAMGLAWLTAVGPLVEDDAEEDFGAGFGVAPPPMYTARTVPRPMRTASAIADRTRRLRKLARR